MTRDRTSLHPIRLRGRRCLAIGAVLGVAGVATFGTGADASPRTKSASIADAAAEAVEALDRWERTLNPVDYVRFVQHRDQAASMTESDVDLADGSLRSAWADVSLAKQEAVLSAVSQLGVPYRYLASEPGVGFDCSGLTIWAFGQAGVDISRVSRDQINEAESIDQSEAVAGDLVYYPGHISIFLGVGMMVHSPNSGSHVEITDLPEKSLRFGDTTTAHDTTTPDSLVDRARAISE
jgi:cell wall-associated NlpC family hydrolase